ncbi:DUF4139 domain-containing protein [Treponema sp. OMZ 840]|uniref:DUF4139 domain-containing protein n=1 Tax=Treponema sp. OMZ 840 TaxID=244313 RepID=UPI003D8F5E4F
MKTKNKIPFIVIFTICMSALIAGSGKKFNQDDIPLKNVTLYSSGVAHYEHEGTVIGSGKIDLLFLPSQINDVLKSIFIKDSAAKNLSINYQSEDTLKKTMESLKIDLSSDDSLFKLLRAQKGAAIEVYTPNKTSGKILSVDKLDSADTGIILSIASHEGVKVIPFNDIQSFRFTDSQRNEDLHKALELILEAAAKTRKQISIDIEAAGERKIGISYVMEAPIWKPTYRLDMAGNTVSFQAWAIIDNSTDLDWNNVKLTLTSGRPVGFKQNLYEPYYTYRETIPVFAGQAARPETFDSAYDEDSVAYEQAAAAPTEMTAKRSYMKMSAAYDDASYFKNQTISDSGAGEMFAFTPVKPVNLPRQKSTMIPLSLTSLPAKKHSVFSNIPYGSSVHPKLCIDIENNSGLKFPAGPITVFEHGEYVGDALLEFLPENEKRLIAFGDDMDVRGTKTEETKKEIQSIKVVQGVLTRTYKSAKSAVYTIKNSGSRERSVIIEHPITSGFKLSDQKALSEKTASKYRFNIKVKENSQEKLSVIEQRFFEDFLQISTMDNTALAAVYSDSEIPEKIKKVFRSIAAEKTKLDEAQRLVANLENNQKNLHTEQDRVRKNLQALGAETQQGKQFLDKLLQIENDLDKLKHKIADAEKKYAKLRADYFEYIKKIHIE